MRSTLIRAINRLPDWAVLIGCYAGGFLPFVIIIGAHKLLGGE